MIACEDYTLQFIKEYANEISDSDIEEVQAKTLFKKFQEFVTEYNFKVDISMTRFGLKLKNLGLKNIIKGRNNKGYYYKIYGIKLYEELGLGANPYVLEESDSD